MRAAVAAVVLLAAASLARGAGDPADEAVAKARAQMLRGEIDDAIAGLLDQRERAPEDSRPNPLLAYLLFTRKGEFDRPVLLLFERLDQVPDDDYSFGLLRQVSQGALAAGDAATAREGFRILRRYDPETKEHLYDWALSSWRMGEADAARGALRQLIDRYPSYAEPYLLLARLELDINAPGRAADAYRSLLVQRPGDVATRLKLASVLLWQLRDFDAAETEYRSALDLAEEGSAAADEARAGRAAAGEQRNLGARLRSRESFLDRLIAGLLAFYAAGFALLVRRGRRSRQPPPGLRSE